ncbi:Hypothetical predicted protein [Paramuricea clavata]|uniref:Uncharacterized protein n=1 Tax=Paramuricea clavata TaxID=317549 RepID=A0A6S7HBS8_PARCT|nr:Hypothetical predicted protein [Paramuricea clavata]
MENSRKSAEIGKKHYDKKIRCTELKPAVRVLMRNLSVLIRNHVVVERRNASIRDNSMDLTAAVKPERLRNERKAQNSGEGAEYEESERDSDDEEFCGFTPAEVYADQPATTTENLAEPLATTMETCEVLDAGLQEQFGDNHGQDTDEPIEEPATRTDTAENEDPTEEAVLRRSVRTRRPPNMLNYDAMGSPTEFPPYLSSVQMTMPATRPSTRIQRRAQSTPWSRRASSHVQAREPAPPIATAASSQATSSAVTAVSDLADATVTRIASVVAQAVVAAIQSPTPSAVVDTREVPLNGRSESGAQVQGPVTSALEHLTGEHVNLEVVRPPSSGSHVQFNSITIPIDAQVSPKIKTKIWANEFIEFIEFGETRYQLSLAQSESSVPTLSLEPSSKIKPIYSIDAWTSAFQIFCWGLHQ